MDAMHIGFIIIIIVLIVIRKDSCEAAYEEGFRLGKGRGWAESYEQECRKDGYKLGYQDGYRNGYIIGYEKGEQSAYARGELSNTTIEASDDDID